MKVKSLVVMGVMASLAFSQSEASNRRNNQTDQGSQFGFSDQFGWGQQNNQDLYQIREVQQSYKEYIQSSSKLANLYHQLDELSAKLGFNQVKIDETQENKRAAKQALDIKADEVNKLEAKLAVLTTEHFDASERVSSIESQIAGIDYDISVEEDKLQPLKDAVQNKKEKLNKHAAKFNKAKENVDKAEDKLTKAKAKYQRLTQDYSSAVAAQQQYQGEIAGIERKVLAYSRQLENLIRKYGTKLEEIQKLKDEIAELERQRRDSGIFSSRRRRLKEEIEKKELVLKAYTRSMPASVIKQHDTAIKRIAELELDKRRVQDQLTQAQDNIDNFQNQATETQAIIDIAQNDFEQEKAAFQPIKEKNEQLSDAFAKARKKLRDESAHLSDLQDKKQKAVNRLSSAQYTLNSAADKLDKKQRQLEREVQAMAQIQIDMENMKEMIKSLNRENRDLESTKIELEKKELKLFEKIANTTLRTHNNQVFHAFVGGLNNITPQMSQKIALAAANGSKIVFWGNMDNQEMLQNLSQITGVQGTSQLHVSHIKGSTSSTQYFELSVNMPAKELFIDQSAVPVLSTLDGRAIMAAKYNENGMGVVITSAIDPNDMNEYDLKAFMEMIAMSDNSEYIASQNPGDIPSDDHTDDSDDDQGDHQDTDPAQPPYGDDNTDPQSPEVFSTGFKHVEKTDIPDNAPQGVTIDMEIEAEKGFILSSAELSIDISHSYIGDIKIELISPEGKSIELRYRKGGSGKVISDIYSSEIMNAFAGEMIRGTWSVVVTDTYNKDTGYIEAIRFSVEGER